MFIPSVKGSQPAFEGATLILPVVSIGNVGQLAVDLLIHGFGLERVGVMSGCGEVPVVGAREGSQQGVTVGVEGELQRDNRPELAD